MEQIKRSINRIDAAAGEILTLLQDQKKKYIFGCGWMGQKFSETIKALGFLVDGYVVSKKDLLEVNGIPVFSLEEMEHKKDAAYIFVALRDQDVQLIKRLKEIFTKVYPITYPKDITVIEAKYYLEYFRNKGVLCEDEILRLGNFNFLNPFVKNDDYLLSWVYEAGDLIMPVIYDDYDRIDEGPYEHYHTELEEGDVVLDCGANIGLFTNIALQKGCKVYAFEPMSDAIFYLNELQKLYGDQMKICPYALADECKHAVFHVQNFDLLGASMLENNNRIDKGYEVEVVTVDDFVMKNQIQRIDYIKADIEGSEREMLKGACKTIRRFHPKISICTYHLSDDKEVLESLLNAIEPRYVIEHRWKKMYAHIPENVKEVSL